ncbi:hypothetical protein [Roseibium sp. RKSG952]|uniref:hypothetical protein n=1 Tax=Roseibium sp. RKSG952 TaxID=2529384 RepID=UPI0012BD709D|nr:hypothetical protein [Roseibium sp. RKSG952]MTH95992.1 hypothetical protein [Roseibium sp. RKSG952]
MDGEDIISTATRINPETGVVFDIKEVDGMDEEGMEVQTLSRGYVVSLMGTGEFEVERKRMKRRGQTSRYRGSPRSIANRNVTEVLTNLLDHNRFAARIAI